MFQLVLHRFSLFQNGLVGVSTATDAMKIDFRSGTDSYDSRNGTYGHVGDVVTNGSVQVGGWAVVDGNARATSFSVYRGAKITGQTTVQTQPEVVMPVQVPDLLTNLGDINLSGSQIQTIGRGSYQVGSIVMGSRAILNIDNCAGPVTLYVTNSSRAVALSDQAEISTCDPNPEKFAIYVANPGSVTMSGDGQFHGVVYAPESPFDISTTSAFYGAFIGNTMHTSGYAKVHYDPSLRGQ